MQEQVGGACFHAAEVGSSFALTLLFVLMWYYRFAQTTLVSTRSWTMVEFTLRISFILNVLCLHFYVIIIIAIIIKNNEAW